MNLILMEAAEVAAGGIAVLTGRRAAHITDVLGAAPGRDLRVGIVDGPLGTAAVVDMTRDTVTLRCTFDAAAPPQPPVDLLLALPRPKVLRRLWAQLAAIGVGRIILTNAARVERNYFDTHLLRPEIYRPLLIEGLQQARDTRVPDVTVHRQFRVLVEDHLSELSDASSRLVAHPADSSRSRACPPQGRVLLAVGPEGGWNAFELQLLRMHGFTAFDAGPRPLRTDTACVALLALVHDAVRRSDVNAAMPGPVS